ncbi:MAG: hypothetical protein HQ521_06540 [Bacteroidetes bacterium]|nr:hypothetical protein [Bacteroidota bacterium]
MPNCFWKKCDCPTKTPTGHACTEHSGVNCSMLNGTAISNLNQVNDGMTASLEAEIAELDNDKQVVETKVQEIKTRKVELERKRVDLERAMRSANSMGSRRRVIRQAKNDIITFSKEKDKMKGEIDDLQRIIDHPRRAIRIARARLIIPFRNPTGFCSCNDRKIQMLDILASHIGGWENERSRLLGRLRILLQVVQLQWVTAIPPTIGIFATLIAIVSFGFGFSALILPVLAFMLVMLIILATHIRIHFTTLELINADRILATLILEYYRVQKIPVCQRPAEESQDEEPWDWWEDWLKELMSPMLPQESGGHREPALPSEDEIPPSD